MGEVRKTDTCGRRSWASAQAGGAGGHLEVGGAETSAALLPRLGDSTGWGLAAHRGARRRRCTLSTTAVEQVSVFVKNGTRITPESRPHA